MLNSMLRDHFLSSARNIGIMNMFFLLADAANNAAGVFFGLGAFGLTLALLAASFWVWMLVDALTNAALDPVMKIVWALVIFFLPFLGALAYLLFGRRPRSGAAI